MWRATVTASTGQVQHRNHTPAASLQSAVIGFGLCGIMREEKAKLGTKVFFYIYCFYFTCVGVLPVCMSLYHVCAVPIEATKGCQIPQHWSYRWL